MKKDLMDILACPTCKGDLQLMSDQENGEEVIAGSLACSPCSHTYPIIDSIPNFLSQEMLE